MAQLRDAIKDLSPAWLREGDAEKFLYTIGLALDALLEKQDQATRAHMPGLCDPTCLPYIGNDKLIFQGPLESSAQYAVRLQAALDAWAEAGSRLAVLGQVQAYLTGTQPGVVGMLPECTIVGGNKSLGLGTQPRVSTWDTIYANMVQGATPVHFLSYPPNWDWDGTYKPWRSWLILFMHLVPTGLSGSTASLFANANGFIQFDGVNQSNSQVAQWVTITGAASPGNNGTFPIAQLGPGEVVIGNANSVANDANNGAIAWTLSSYPFIGPDLPWDSPDTTWDDGGAWGVSCRPQILTSIRQLVQRWKSAGAYYPNIIVAFDGGAGGPSDMFSPYGTQNPAGTWGNPSRNVGGVMVPARVTLSPYDEFCDGTGRYAQCSVHNVT